MGKKFSIFTPAAAAKLAAKDAADLSPAGEIPPAAAAPAPATEPAPDPVEEQAEGEEVLTLSGYAVVWGVNSDEGSPRRFDKGNVSYPTDRPVLCLYNHDDSNVLGSTANNTLKIEPDDYGIKVTCTLPGTTLAEDVYELVEDRYVSGMSCGYFETAATDENGIHIPTIVIDEFSICPVPAFISTSVDVLEADSQDFENLNLDDEEEPDFQNLVLQD
jgi:HK97 family phage prohead protease